MRERKLSDYYVNQEVWDFQLGWGKVTDITSKPDPIVCTFKCGRVIRYFVNGRANAGDINPSLFFEEFIILESANIPKRWTPKDGELYYTITKNRCLCVTFLRFNNSLNDENNINQDNCFKTEKEAQEKLDKILEVLKGE